MKLLFIAVEASDGWLDGLKIRFRASSIGRYGMFNFVEQETWIREQHIDH